MIAIVDYGAGNLFSVKNALDSLGAASAVTSDENEILQASGVILPGVGAFPLAMQMLTQSALVPAVRTAAAEKPFLGICLGMQMLLEWGFEFQKCEGLGILPGRAEPISAPGLKIPHMGWNSLSLKSECPLFYGIEQGILYDDYKRLLVSPTCLKQRILEEIKRETERGGEGCICMKMNSLTDKDVIDSLICASRAGVKILLIIRGICCLRAGIEGLTDNIRVISIVGRYLEHSRIYAFGRGEARVYIGSADMMTRNTTRRIEVMTPVLDPRLIEKLRDIIELELRDNVKACEMQPDGSYKKIESQGEACDSQIEMYKLYK